MAADKIHDLYQFGSNIVVKPHLVLTVALGHGRCPGCPLTFSVD